MATKKSTNISLNEAVGALSQNIIITLKEILELVCLEGRLAGKSLLIILGLIFAISFLVVTTWICLIAAITYCLTLIGLSLLCALLLMVLFNLLLIALFIAFIVSLHRNLYFSKTRQQLNYSELSQ